MMSEGVVGVTSLSFTGPLGWCQWDSFTRGVYATGSNPISEDALCFQSKPPVTALLFSVSTYNTSSKSVFVKPIKAARQSGETKFPLSETIC